MRHLRLVAVLGAVAAAAAPGAARAAGNPYLHEQASATPGADQGSNSNYRSYITAVTPRVPGLQVQILAFADRLQIFNHTGRIVTIYGYQGEAYARLLPDGSVQLNERSPALYLNASFYGGGTIPASANPSSPPQWVTVFRTGTYQWHDHRIHWPSPELPPQVKDKGKRTLIFNWAVPIDVGGARGAISGQLFWTPSASKASAGAYIALAAIAVLGIALVLIVRRRRTRRPGAGDEDEPGARRSAREAW